MEDKRKQNKSPIGQVVDEGEYKSSHLNWRDDGNEVEDPSMNDYLKGYNIDPYEFRQWAKVKGKKLEKKADMEVVVMQFTPEFLADRILTLWNGTDGPLQNFFEAFTLRYNNNLKEQIASILGSKGYYVYPVLTDDMPRYARIKKLMRKASASNNLDNIMVLATTVANSDALNLFAGELADLREAGTRLHMNEAAGILEYYREIYPEDYAIMLVHKLMNHNPEKLDTSIKNFEDHDFDFSDEALNKIEDFMSGNANPYYLRDGGEDGYNFVTDMRNFDGVRPEFYEVTGSKKKQKSQQQK